MDILGQQVQAAKDYGVRASEHSPGPGPGQGYGPPPGAYEIQPGSLPDTYYNMNMQQQDGSGPRSASQHAYAPEQDRQSMMAPGQGQLQNPSGTEAPGEAPVAP